MSTKRTRLSPEARREQLLDVAKQSILEGGLQQFSLKKLAPAAGVSEPLLFHYFASRTELLQQLLERDFVNSIETLNSALTEANTLDEILAIYVAQNYDRHNEGNVVDLLLVEPDIASAVDEIRTKNSRDHERLLINTIAAALGIRRKQAALIAVMASAASMSAAKFAHENKVGRGEAIDTVVEFVKAGFESQRRNNK